MSILDSGRAKVIGLGVVLVLLAAAFVTVAGGPETKSLTAHFSRAVSVYEGTDVRVMGVSIGKVTAVVPEGESVRVDMEYDAEYSLPADARAVIITPTLVADRFVQVTPVHTGGEAMADGGEIPLAETGTPVELDRIYASLSDLSNALGPNGANRTGALDDLLTAGARTLDGKGATANRMLLDMSRAAETFGNNSGSLFDTVQQLNTFTGTLARNDRVVDQFINDLGRASAQLAGERQELDAMLRALARAIGTVEAFVRENRGALTGRVEELTTVLDELVKEKDSLALALEKGPTAASNLHVAFDSRTGSIGSRVNVDGNIEDLDGFLCAMVKNASIPDDELACEVFEQLLEGSGMRMPSAGNRMPAPDARVPGEAEPAEGLDELLGGGGR
jgi:phospholipid/cholesterol/gamma-HCH transport system substrate-binding protein